MGKRKSCLIEPLLFKEPTVEVEDSGMSEISSKLNVQWAAFYSDVEHVIAEVTQG
ncbi:hypothetical protein M427DRAFT_290437 [Gonapodya prolifera JEL478]|uniref:Uncharacterized protein n=1 Tax=Gonapodya prolifera (strain JEL478) TaxID=1344416 RepID=A0A139AI34_GONPJ|nr:hypothetical protein M427DRAFT_290437 [Gonapodya prolifera JEL478]|eukprot:KXS16420.1 hypothetical protein M427DRAFT_290437 [Gonapodya prolifera JEL478]